MTKDDTARASQGSMEGATIAGKYQLMRMLGAGGMGAVYEARNADTLKRCAVKLLLSPDFNSDDHVVKRFFREARASSVIESDHVVQIFDSGSDPDTTYPYMVMELLSGEDLSHTIHRMGALDPVVAGKLALQAAMGLAKAHEAGIIHRDIKPANLFLTQRDSGDLVLKILDFGVAKVVMEQFQETSHGLTRTGSMLGTPLYMSPEQAKGASRIDARSDVWSLGVVMFELLSGRLPFEDANSLGELMVSIITGDIPLLQDLAPWVPPELAEIAHRAMSRNIDLRYANGGEFREALAEVMPDGPRVEPTAMKSVSEEHRAYVAPRLELTDDGMLRATTRSGLSTTTNTSPRRKSRAPAVILSALGGLAVLGVGGVTAYKLSRHTTATAESAAASKPAPTALASNGPSVTPAAPDTKTFELGVAPDGVEVSVDGATRSVKDHAVELSGAPGETRKVKLTLGNKSVEQLVAITESGLLPPKLSIARAATPAPTRVVTSRTKAPAKSAPPPPARSKAPPKPPAKNTPQISKDLGEFGN
jgi:eukaryotic-like serine/threonine-protein kinase